MVISGERPFEEGPLLGFPPHMYEGFASSGTQLTPVVLIGDELG